MLKITICVVLGLITCSTLFFFKKNTSDNENTAATPPYNLENSFAKNEYASNAVSYISDSSIVHNIEAKQDDSVLTRLLLEKKGIYFGAYLSSDAVTLRSPYPKNFLDKTAKYFTLFSLPAWYWHVEPKKPGVFDFTGPDAVADFAKIKGAKLQAHNLVWHGAQPDWLKKGNYTPDQLSNILKNHIQTVVKHYRDKYPGMVIAWDVVNECMSDSSNLDPKHSYPNGLRKNLLWGAIHKPGSTDPTDFIQLAFQWAHEADPNAVLYWNEFHVEYKGFKMDRWYKLVKELKDKGVPIGGAGFQGHITLAYNHPASELLENMNRFADIGIQSQITEMDVMMFYKNKTPPYGLPRAINPTKKDFQNQAVLYRDFFRVCLEAKNCNAFIVQGFWDRYSWMNWAFKNSSGKYEGPFYPGLFDDNLKPKPSLKTLLKEMRENLN